MSTVNTSHSDSEEDEDYVPPAGDGAESSDSEPEAKRARTKLPLLTVEDEAAKKSAREDVWTSFHSSVSIPTPQVNESTPKRMVKVEKRYLFAGEEVIEVVEVPDDSPEAKKWPLWRPSEEKESPFAKLVSLSATPDVGSSSSQTPPPPKPQLKRPGPRKPKTMLAALPGASKAKKLTTLDKSAMDWRAHVQAQEESGMKDELEANRRGGGYLEKVEFLKRVDERKEENLETLKGSKRRRG